MLVKRLYSYVTDNSDKYSVIVDTKQEKAKVVIDGLSFFYSICDRLMEKEVEKVFCYESLKEEMTRLLDYMTGRGIVVEGIFIGMNNNSKRYDQEAEKLTEREKRAMDAVNSNFANPPTGIITYFTSYMLIKLIEEYYGNTSLVHYGGTDGDRDVARFANTVGAYVLTKSSSYFVLPVPGVITVDWLLREYANAETANIHSIRVFKGSLVASVNGLDRSHFLFAMICQGDGTTYRPFLPGMRKSSSHPIESLLNYAKSCANATPRELADKYATGCCNAEAHFSIVMNRKGCAEQYRKQYNRLQRSCELDSYPQSPLCFFTDNTWFVEQYKPLFEKNCSHSLEEAGRLLASMLTFTKTHIIALLSFYDSVPVFFGFSDPASLVVERTLMAAEQRFVQLVDTGNRDKLDEEPMFSLIGFHDRTYNGSEKKADAIGKRFTNAFRLRSLSLQERRSLLSDIFVDMKSVDMTQIPDEKLLLVFCVGMMHFTIQKFTMECDTKMWMKYFLFALFHHERVHNESKAWSVPSSWEERKYMVSLFSLLSSFFKLVASFMTFLNLPTDADFLKKACIFCVEYLAFHPDKYATLASTEDRTPLEQFCLDSFTS